MIYTLQHAANYVAPFVESGMAPNDPRLFGRINEAIARILMIPGLWKNLTRMMVFNVPAAAEGVEQMFVAPPFVNQFLKVWIDNRPVDVHTMWFEFMANELGPTELGHMNRGVVVSKGDLWPVKVQPTEALEIYAISTDGDDAGSKITVMGEDENGDEIWTITEGIRYRGIELEIADDNSKMSTQTFTKITGIVKPQTNAFVRLYANQTGTAELLSVYAPDEISPAYHAYCINNRYANAACKLYALVKVAFAPALYPSDPLLVQNLHAIKAMCQACKAYDAENLPIAQAHEMHCRQILNDQISAEVTPEAALDVDSPFHVPSLR